MFGRMMNNYYYGKSGKGDFRKDDLPQTRMQLFWDTLRTRLSSLFRLNLIYMVAWIPTFIVILLSVSNFWSMIQNDYMVENNDYAAYVQVLQDAKMEVPMTEEQYNSRREFLRIRSDANYEAYTKRATEEGQEKILTQDEFIYVRSVGYNFQNELIKVLLWLIPCIAITGPLTAGLSYVTRNWARDEHAFIWSDLKDAAKENWKHSLVLSIITGAVPVVVYVGWITYSRMTDRSVLAVIPQMLVAMVGAIWYISITYMHPLTVTYSLKLRDMLKNGFLLGIARLPFSVGIRLLHCVPTLIAAGAVWFFGMDLLLAVVLLFAYYALIGFALSRFITASYTNAVFDRFINSRIEGAKVNQGLREKDDDDDEEDAEDAAEESGTDTDDKREETD